MAFNSSEPPMAITPYTSLRRQMQLGMRSPQPFQLNLVTDLPDIRRRKPLQLHVHLPVHPQAHPPLPRLEQPAPIPLDKRQIHLGPSRQVRLHLPAHRRSSHPQPVPRLRHHAVDQRRLRLLQVVQRVHRALAVIRHLADLEVQVRSGAVTCVPALPDRLPGLDRLIGLDRQAAQVAIDTGEAHRARSARGSRSRSRPFPPG